jgi:putative SOS response-associated peptidase YedK
MSVPAAVTHGDQDYFGSRHVTQGPNVGRERHANNARTMCVQSQVRHGREVAMCGRFTHRLTWEQIRDLYRLTDARQGELDLKPRYNAAPTDVMPVCRLDRSGQREIAVLRWGLIPFWANDPKVGFKSINARAETVATAPAFRDAFKRHRCLVPANGFYEWKKLAGGGKQPYLIQMRDGTPFSFAGLWDRWNKGEAPIESFTIITGEPNSLVADLHDRMPVILDPADYDAWPTGSS